MVLFKFNRKKVKMLKKQIKELSFRLADQKRVNENLLYDMIKLKESSHLDKPARITEQDARQIANSVANSKCGSFWEWYESNGRTLLNKLNADRVPAVSVPEGWEFSENADGSYTLIHHHTKTAIDLDNAVAEFIQLLLSTQSHSQQSADSSESLREIIEREADRFFEWPSADKSHVTAVSTKLFAEHIATLYASPIPANKPAISLDQYDAGHLNDYGGGNVGWWHDYIRSELERAYDFYQDQVSG